MYRKRWKLFKMCCNDMSATPECWLPFSWPHWFFFNILSHMLNDCIYQHIEHGLPVCGRSLTEPYSQKWWSKQWIIDPIRVSLALKCYIWISYWNHLGIRFSIKWGYKPSKSKNTLVLWYHTKKGNEYASIFIY